MKVMVELGNINLFRRALGASDAHYIFVRSISLNHVWRLGGDDGDNHPLLTNIDENGYFAKQLCRLRNSRLTLRGDCHVG